MKKTLTALRNNSPNQQGSLQLLTDKDDKGICFLSRQTYEPRLQEYLHSPTHTPALNDALANNIVLKKSILRK